MGPFGYQFRMTPRTPYRLFSSRSGDRIRGLSQGVLFGVTDAEGYTRFVRMSHPVPEEAWRLDEVFGSLGGRYGEAFSLQDSRTGMGLEDFPYALVELPAGNIYFGRTGRHGLTAYLQTLRPRTLEFHDMSMHDWTDEDRKRIAQLRFKVDILWRRHGHFRANLYWIEETFREQLALEASLLERLGRVPESHEGAEGEDPGDELAGLLHEAEATGLILRAGRAAFLVAHGRSGLAEPDVAVLLDCPELPSDAREPVDFLGRHLGRDPRARILAERVRAMGEPH
nr:hypothetical protein [uncultured Holophaga sp.]